MKGLLDPRNGVAFDLPPVKEATRNYIIASIPRSGSTLLARMLWECGVVGAPKEYLNPMQLRDWEVRDGRFVSRCYHAALRGRLVGAVAGRGWSVAALHRHVARVRRLRSSGGWFGVKLHHHHFLRLGGQNGVQPLLPNARWIRIHRNDRLGQALSWHRALDSGRWAAWQNDARSPRYRRASIARRLRAIDKAETGWDTALEHCPVLRVSYEALVERPEETIRSVLMWLDVQDAAHITVPEFPTRRQADDLSRVWRQRWASGA